MSDIIALTGKRGTGKTYYTVQKLLDEYYKYNKVSDYYELKESNLVITNIDGFLPDHVSFDDILKKYPNFFDINFQYEKFSDDKYEKKIMVLSEAHKMINRMKEAEIHFFNESRHLDWEIVLDTQNIKLIDYRIREIIDYEIRGVSRSLMPEKILFYNQIESGEIVRRIKLFKKQIIFDNYKSQKKAYGVKKRSNNLTRTVFIICIIAAFLIWRACGTYERKMEHMKESERKRQQKYKTEEQIKKGQTGGIKLENHKNQLKYNPNQSQKPQNISNQIENQQTNKQPLLIPTRLNWFYLNGKINIVIGNNWIPLDQLPYEISHYTKTSNNNISAIYAKIPIEYVPFFNPPSETNPGEIEYYNTPAPKLNNPEKP